MKIYQPFAISLPFTLWIFYSAYNDTGIINWLGILLILLGIFSIYFWIRDYQKEKYLRGVIDWL